MKVKYNKSVIYIFFSVLLLLVFYILSGFKVFFLFGAIACILSLIIPFITHSKPHLEFSHSILKTSFDGELIPAEFNQIDIGEIFVIKSVVKAKKSTGLISIDFYPNHFLGYANEASSKEVVILKKGEEFILENEVKGLNPGKYIAGELVIQYSSAMNLFWNEYRVDLPLISVLPDISVKMKSALIPSKTTNSIGNYTSNMYGEGFDFADIQEYQGQDRIKHINWKLSAKKGKLYVNRYYQESNANILFIIDNNLNYGTFELNYRGKVIEAISMLAKHYTKQKDRVSLIEIGMTIRRIPFHTGKKHFQRIIEFLIELSANRDPIFKSGGIRIPERMLPQRGLVYVFTSSTLDNEDILSLIRRMRKIKLDVVVISIDVMGVAINRIESEEWKRIAGNIFSIRYNNRSKVLSDNGIIHQNWSINEPFHQIIKRLEKIWQRRR